MREFQKKLPEFDAVYQENGLTIDQFQTFAASDRTIKRFIAGYETLLGQIRIAVSE